MLSQHTRGEAWRQSDATATCPGTPGTCHASPGACSATSGHGGHPFLMATITRSIHRSEVGWVRAELARNHKNAVGR